MSHVQAWDENCGWAKLRLFELDGYDTILYIDADCLVVKDVSHLLRVDSTAMDTMTNKNNSQVAQRSGLLAAAPDIFPPDKFNAGVMVLRPSKAVFNDMMARLPGVSPNSCTSYDGGDTGFLNSYYPNWFGGMPEYSRLSFGYNAQRFMHHCTYEKQPKYWDDGIDDVYIVHFSSSPKPWETKSSNEASDNTKAASYLGAKDSDAIQKAVKHGTLESKWQLAFDESEEYFVKMQKKQSKAGSKRSAQTPTHKTSPAAARTSSARASAASTPSVNNPRAVHQRVHKRYKELRKTGMSTTEAMSKSRAFFCLDSNDIVDPSRAVGQMFGLM
jgi:glycogenin glucosyltransferase